MELKIKEASFHLRNYKMPLTKLSYLSQLPAWLRDSFTKNSRREMLTKLSKWFAIVDLTFKILEMTRSTTSRQHFLRHVLSKTKEKPLVLSSFSLTKVLVRYKKTLWSSCLFFTQCARDTTILSIFWFVVALTRIILTFMGRLRYSTVCVKVTTRQSRSWFHTVLTLTSLTKTDSHLCSTR
jgi:hypothetical protein